MRHYLTAFLAAGLASSALALAQGHPATGQSIPLTLDVEQRSFTVTGTVVSARSDALVVRIDDHGHRITFSPGPRVSPAELRAGSRVSVRYHPAGSTGQIADAVEVLAGPRSPGAR
jgi:ferric-dicitrate binding protein FerR (iron transport regulator)